MAKQKLTKKQREDREENLVNAIFNGLTTMVAEYATAWARRAERLSEGLSATSIKRARKIAALQAEDMPPGHVKCMDATDIFDDVCKRNGISKRDQDLAWGAIAQVCMFQLAARHGNFYEAARDFGVVPDPRPIPVAEVIKRIRPDRVLNPEDLN